MDIVVLRAQLAGIGVEIAALRVWLLLNKYSPDQPRVPAGQPTGGQWTSGDWGDGVDANADGSGDGGDISSDVAWSGDTAAEGTAATGDGMTPTPWFSSTSDGAGEVRPIPVAKIIEDTSPKDNPAIVATTRTLTSILSVIADDAGPGFGSTYGTRVHKLFADAVRLNDLPGIGRDGVEQSFIGGDKADYGEEGSIRTDVIVRGAAGEIIAIYDLKTGDAFLSPRREQALRSESGARPDVPVIVLKLRWR